MARFSNWWVKTRISCVSCFHVTLSHDSCFRRSPENQLKGYILLQIKNNKTTFLWSLSWGFRADKVPRCHVTRLPISAEFERGNEPWGNKRSLITTPKPSCRPQPAPQTSHWQLRHSWGQRREIVQPTQLTLFSVVWEQTASNIRLRGERGFFRFDHCLHLLE